MWTPPFGELITESSITPDLHDDAPDLHDDGVGGTNRGSGRKLTYDVVSAGTGTYSLTTVLRSGSLTGAT